MPIAAYQVLGGKPGKVITVGVGILTSLFALGISFVPPASVQAESKIIYSIILAAGFLIALALPFILYALRDERWKQSAQMPKRIPVEEVRSFTHPCYRGVSDCTDEER